MSGVVVIKIGGSLLNVPGALARVSDWLAANRGDGQTRLLLAGGGEAVEALRSLDAANPLPAADTHWAAIRMMDVHTRLLPRWLPGFRLTDTLPANEGVAGDWAFVCEPFLRRSEPGADGERLSVGWGSTSDAIAARLAEIVGGRLVLLKHTLDPSQTTLAAACEAGSVDPETPRHAAGVVSVELVSVFPPGEGLQESPGCQAGYRISRGLS